MISPLYWTADEVDLSFAGEITANPETLFSCIQCGSCTASCPTANTMKISPQGLSRLIRLGIREPVLSAESFWLCTSCGACTEHCPRGIPFLDIIIGLKSHVMQTGRPVPEDLTLLRKTITDVHNVSGDDNQERLVWSRNLPQPLVGIDRHRDADVLYFVGCISAFYPRAYPIPQAFGRTLQRAGIQVTTLGGNEWCCGYPLYNAGLANDLGPIVEHNVKQVRALGIKTLVMTCPSCFYTWKRVYPRFCSLPADLTVLHASQLLAELLDAKRIRPGILSRVVTYHDPCDLGRKGGEYEAPRHILRSLAGVELREMANIRGNALCCGGGGDVKILSHDTTTDVARRRLRQAMDVGADTIVSACQQCRRALLSAVQWARQPIKVYDVTELVWETMLDKVEW